MAGQENGVICIGPDVDLKLEQSKQKLWNDFEKKTIN